jgi:hypothetical protein
LRNKDWKNLNTGIYHWEAKDGTNKRHKLKA